MSTPVTHASVPHLAPPRFRGAGLTHVGRVRERNEDSILTDPTGVLWAVADGVGGYGHGDVASDIVIEALSQVPDSALPFPALRERLDAANREIYLRAQQLGQMGATVVALMIQNSVAHIAWAGDCRAYLMRHGALRLLTRDHTVVQDLMDQGLLSPENVGNHPESNVVTRAAGTEPHLDIETLGVPLVSGDRIVLCSDGLTTCLGDHEIADRVFAAETPEALAGALVSAALEQGAPDNVSVIAVFAGPGA